MDNEYALREAVRDMTVKAGEDEELKAFVKPWSERIPDSMDAETVYAEYLAERHGDTHALETGWEPWDSLVGPFRKGNLYLLCGYPGTGKTTLSAMLSWRLARKGAKVWYFCMELTPAETLEVIAGTISGNSRPTHEQVTIAAHELQKVGFRFFDPSRSKSWKEHIDTMRREVKAKGIDFLVIDNFHFLTRVEKDQYSAEAVASQRLKQLSQELRIPILLLHHLRKPEGDTLEPEPTVHAAKGAGALIADASAVILLHHPLSQSEDDDAPDREPVGYIRCSKPRWGQGGKRYVRLLGHAKRYDAAQRIEYVGGKKKRAGAY